MVSISATGGISIPRLEVAQGPAASGGVRATSTVVLAYGSSLPLTSNCRPEATASRGMKVRAGQSPPRKMDGLSPTSGSHR